MFTQEQMTNAILAFQRAGSDVRKTGAKALVMACYDGHANGSAKMANALIGSVRRSIKRAGMVAFLETFGGVFDSGGTMIAFPPARKEWTEEFSDLVKDESIDWESYKPASGAPPNYDVVKAVEAVVKAGNKAIDRGRVVDGELVDYLVALLGQYVGNKAVDTAKRREAALVEIVEIVEAA